MAAEHHDEPIHHVLDSTELELLGLWKIELPNVLGFQITKFMVMEVVAALLIIAIVVPLARHVARNKVTRGPLLNAFEAMVVFIRDGVARPAIGGHDADAFLPYLWTVFFFVLFCNLLGLVPGGASPTGDINVTGVLAAVTLGTVFFAGMRAQGVAGFFKGIVPHLDVPRWLHPFLWVLMFVIELFGLLIKHFVLAVRLFANMLAGHIVLTVILSFILMASGIITYLVTPASVLGVVALSLLELLVAFLQAYIFAFLAAVFIGSVQHAH